jgi:transposase-like protein
MARKRRLFTAVFKAKVALAAARGDQSTAELAAKFSVHTNQVTAWKKQLLAGVPELFADRRGRPPEASADEQELYEQIGRLKMQVEWLKKKSIQLD